MTEDDNTTKREVLVEIYKTFDKELIAITSSALGLSFVFLEKFDVVNLAILVSLWISLTISLVVQLWSFLLSAALLEIKIGWWGKLRKTFRIARGKKGDVYMAKCVWYINFASLSFLTISIILFLLLASDVAYEKRKENYKSNHSDHTSEKVDSKELYNSSL
jgi:hypothetical protein